MKMQESTLSAAVPIPTTAPNGLDQAQFEADKRAVYKWVNVPVLNVISRKLLLLIETHAWSSYSPQTSLVLLIGTVAGKMRTSHAGLHHHVNHIHKQLYPFELVQSERNQWQLRRRQLLQRCSGNNSVQNRREVVDKKTAESSEQTAFAYTLIL